MEPERKIEKWLRAYAKKRRGQEGPMKMHPATRRLLQSEIARTTPKPGDEDDSLSLWEVLRQQWAFLLAFALCIFIGATMLYLPLSSAKKKAQPALAMSSLKQIDEAVHEAAAENNGELPKKLDDLKASYSLSDNLTDRSSGGPFVYLGAGKNLRDLSSNSVLAYSSEDKNGRAVLFADGRTAVVSPQSFSEITNNVALAPTIIPSTGLALPAPAAPAPPPPTEVAASDVPAPPPPPTETAAPGSEPVVAMATPPPPPQESAAAAPEAAAAPTETEALAPIQAPGTAAQGGAPVLQGARPAMARREAEAKLNQPGENRQLYYSLRNMFKNAVEPSQAGPVLANFEVQQNGNAIRVVDQDGSVYEGSLELVAAQNEITQSLTSPDQTQAVQNRLVQNSASIASGLPSQSIAIAKDSFQLAQNYFFRVHGTNQTTKQPVVFTGNLLANEAMATNIQTFGANNNFDSGLSTMGGAGGIGGFGGGGGGGGGFGGGVSEKEATNQVVQLPWSSLRISGTAVVNVTNQIQINAAPVPQTKN